jgi:photosystem II stability/assembly factor-like uncharacterized protein
LRKAARSCSVHRCVLSAMAAVVASFFWLRPAGAASPIPPMFNVAMANARLGWGITVTGQLLRTEDGGIRWIDISPPGFRAGPVGPVAANFDMQVSVGGAGTATFLRVRRCHVASCYDAWLYASSPRSGGAAQISRIFFSHNGGTTWVALPVHGVLLRTWWRASPVLDFVDAKDGWMLCFPVLHAGAASGTEAQVFRTVDGGVVWRRIADVSFSPNQPATASQPAAFGLGFATPTMGWLTGLARGHPWLRRTDNGGTTWTNVALIEPPGVLGSAWTLTLPPRFFGSDSGVLPVVFGIQQSGSPCLLTVVCAQIAQGARLILYNTNNGGATWDPSSPVPIEASAKDPGLPLVSIWSRSASWVSSGPRFWLTRDFGHTWMQIHAVPTAYVTSIVVTSPTSALVSTLLSPKASLWETRNGGASWRPLDASLGS